MKLTIFGATGGIGRHAVEQAVSAGHEVTAVARNADRVSANVTTVTADLAHPTPPALRAAVGGADGVLSTIGPRSAKETGIASRGTRTIAESMRATGSRRFVVISAAPIGTVPSPARPRRPSTIGATASSFATSGRH